MRCLACGAEMHLMHVIQDDTMPVPGYEHRTSCVRPAVILSGDLPSPETLDKATPNLSRCIQHHAFAGSYRPARAHPRLRHLEARIRKVAWQTGVGSPSTADVITSGRTGGGQHHSAFLGSI